ncbi:MAG: thioredoxin [Bacteroidetes bacterium]|jgi:thioredoxin 1|nr:thioredoxin [Bacteroidota bacterium]MBP6428683.1 thioredoxin [Bacteroidia bacterium]MBK7570317.1 thioredoxin [Bacteroidota bacterium]MBK8363601.1 thioredoxin [Bacteroidota bacterium]MBK9414629.1 thioredoxin [Bacteroidota bacterium]
MSKFNDIINSEVPTLVDFSATWCGPCKMMEPILQNLSKKVGNSARILKVDIDKNPAVANLYQIQSVPTLLLFVKGEIKWRQSGVVNEQHLAEIISKF